MEISFDPIKNDRNIAQRNLAFDRAAEFDFLTARIEMDDRFDYGETRLAAVGFLDARLHVLCYVEIEGGIRVISFRKANKREARRYAKN